MRHAASSLSVSLLSLAIPLTAQGARGVAPSNAETVGGARAVGQLVSQLTVETPSAAGPFVVHTTLAIAPRAFDRLQCPYRIVDPDGTALPTQWELVARLVDGIVV